VRAGSQKVRTATRYGVRLVSAGWLLGCAATGCRQDEQKFLLSPPSASSLGIVTGTTVSSSTPLGAENVSTGRATMGSTTLINSSKRRQTSPAGVSLLETLVSGPTPAAGIAQQQPPADSVSQVESAEARITWNLRLALEVARTLVPPTSSYWRGASSTTLRLIACPHLSQVLLEPSHSY